VQDELAKLEAMKAKMDGKGISWLPDYGISCMSQQLKWLEANRSRILEYSAQVARDAQPSPETTETLPTAAE